MNDELGLDLPAGGPHYRAYVGGPDKYDLLAALQFNLLTSLGLREYHSLLDIGCGSLRAGRLFISYLLPERYCGVEPERWLIDEAIKKELGQDILGIKRPAFAYDAGFGFAAFGRKFDYLLAQSVFTHASKGQIGQCLTQARAVMTPASIFAATYLRGDTDYEGSEWVYPACVPYQEATVRSLAAARNLASVPLAYPHPAGVSWILFFAI